MANYKCIIPCNYGKLDPKVNLEPDFFTGFKPENRKEIVSREAAFYHSITEPYSVNDQLDISCESFKADDGYEINVKIYRPKNADGKLPALMFFHGGGFMTCSVETHDFVPAYLAVNAGVVAFNVEYRLAPEYKFPIGLEDSYSACLWVVDSAERFGVDPEKLVVCGDSSGGNFSAALTLMAKARGNLHIDKQVLIYPATDLAGAVEKRSAEVYAPVGGESDGPSPMLAAYLNSLDQVRDPLVSPILAEDLSGLPKALFIEAECDSLVDDGLIYANLLQEAGVPVECHIYSGMPHAFILRTYEETFSALDTICEFLRT